MSFFDDVSRQARDFAAVADRKAREVADSAKTTAAIMSEQREIEKNYRVIGEWFVNDYEGDAPAAIADVVAAVKASQEKIAALRASREQPAAAETVVDAGRACPNCGEVSNGKFCPKCGSPMAAVEEPVPAPAVEDEAPVEEPTETPEAPAE